jgi:hypothetical protein
MALRAVRGAGRGRAGRSGARVVLLALGLYLSAGLLATAPAVQDARTHFLGYGAPQPGIVTPGDHLQTAYNLWLPGHQVERAAAPWIDPYSFQPVVEPRVNFAGWPFSLVWWPLHALLDTVGAWNAFVLLTYLGAGAFAALWLRALGLSLGAALVGGLAFAVAPYRVAQSTGHLLGPISMLLPLSLWALETRRGVLAAAAIASIPLSGQVHLALGAIPFFAAYAWIRRGRRAALPGAVAALAAGLLVWAASLRGAAERPFSEVERYSAELGDFVSRDVREFEAFVFLGWLLPLAALAGLALLARERRRLAVVLGVAALVPAVLALGANLPGYRTLWEHTPLHSTRVPERLMPIACLSLAGLLAVAVDRVRWRHAALVAAALVALDLRAGVTLYDPLEANEDNFAYAALRGGQPGSLLEVPTFGPDAYAGSVFLYYAMQAPRERPLGYSTASPAESELLAERLGRAACRGDARGLRRLLDRLDVGYVAHHRELAARPDAGGTCPIRMRLLFPRLGLRPVARDAGVELLRRDAGAPR